MFNARIVCPLGGFSREHRHPHRHQDSGSNGLDYRNVRTVSAVDGDTQNEKGRECDADENDGECQKVVLPRQVAAFHIECLLAYAVFAFFFSRCSFKDETYGQFRSSQIYFSRIEAEVETEVPVLVSFVCGGGVAGFVLGIHRQLLSEIPLAGQWWGIEFQIRNRRGANSYALQSPLRRSYHVIAASS
jgi:hypothetical protein